MGVTFGVEARINRRALVGLHSDLGAMLLADRQLLADAARGTVNDLEEEQAYTSFVTIVDAISSLRTTWSQQRQAFASQNGGHDTAASDRAWQYGSSIFVIGCTDGVLPPKACEDKT